MAGEEKTEEERLKKANEPVRLAMKYHTYYAEVRHPLCR